MIMNLNIQILNANFIFYSSYYLMNMNFKIKILNVNLIQCIIFELTINVMNFSIQILNVNFVS